MTSKQEQALAALMVHATRKEAAASAGISERTLREYFKDTAFRAEYRRRCFEIIEDAARQSRNMLRRALAVFDEIMSNPDEKSAVRLAAADRAAEYAAKLSERADIAAELEELRGMIDEARN